MYSLGEMDPLPVPMADVPGHKDKKGCGQGKMENMGNSKTMTTVERTIPTTIAMQEMNTELPRLPLPVSESLRTSGDFFYNTDEKLWISPQEQ